MLRRRFARNGDQEPSESLQRARQGLIEAFAAANAFTLAFRSRYIIQELGNVSSAQVDAWVAEARQLSSRRHWANGIAEGTQLAPGIYWVQLENHGHDLTPLLYGPLQVGLFVRGANGLEIASQTLAEEALQASKTHLSDNAYVALRRHAQYAFLPFEDFGRRAIFEDPLLRRWWVLDGHEVLGIYLQRQEALNVAIGAAPEPDEDGDYVPPAAAPNALEPVHRFKAADIIALVYNPKVQAVYAVLQAKWSREVKLHAFDGELVGTAYLDEFSLGSCARTHSPAGVSVQGMGLELCLYSGLAALALSAYGLPCIASAPRDAGHGHRSASADEWWGRAVKGSARYAPLGRMLDEAGCDTCEAVDTERLVETGILFWLARPPNEDWETLCRETTEGHLEALLLASVTDAPRPQLLQVLEEVLADTGAADEAIEAWREAHLGTALVANRRRGRKRKPSFATPELERVAAKQYAMFEEW